MRAWVTMLCLALVAGCNAHNSRSWSALKPAEESEPPQPRVARGLLEELTPQPRQLVVRPMDASNAIRTERVVIATLYDDKNQPRRGRRIEWILEGAGSIVEVDEGSWLGGRGHKSNHRSAVSYTNYNQHRLTRGTEDPSDDYMIRPGQTWCVITSATPGDTHLTVHAPDIEDRKSARVFVTHHWVDAQWTFPPAATARTGSERSVTTTVLRHADRQPLPGYRVRYRIIDGPPAVFTQSQTTEAVAVSDPNGHATVTLTQSRPAAGTNRIAVEIIRTTEPNAASGLGIVIGQGESTVAWDAPAIGLRLDVPATVLSGQPIPCKLVVQNTGVVEARSMIVRTPIPEGMTVVRSDPPAVVEGNMLLWTLGALNARGDRAVEVVFQPSKLGPVNLRASVVTEEGLSAERDAATSVTEPKLALSMTGPQAGAVGVPLSCQLTVSNPGTAPTAGVVLRASLDPGLDSEVKANPIELKLDRPLAPGESRVIPLPLIPRQAGTPAVRVEARGPNDLKAQAEHRLTIQQASLSVKLSAPGVRFVDKPVTWELEVVNTGQAPLSDVILRDLLPEEVKFASASDGGRAQGREVVWQLGALRPGDKRTVQLTGQAMAVAPKTLNRVRAEAGVEGIPSGPGVLREEKEAALEIRGLPAFGLQVTDDTDPLEVGQQATYRIEVTNQGTLRGNAVEVTADLPTNLRLIGVHALAPYRVQGQKIIFARRDGLEPRQTWAYFIRVEAVEPGDVRFKAEMKTDTLAAPVQKEQSTTVYR